jgi:AbrB family looped-hinge helix DNA binding protein
MSNKSEVVQLLRVSPEGRVLIPAKMRRALCLQPGDPVVATLEGDRLVLRPRRALDEELWAMFASVDHSMADELIQERREEARRESLE